MLTLPGKVEKIIESSHPKEPEKAQISVGRGRRSVSRNSH